MEKIEQFFKTLVDLLISPRFISFYWTTGITAVVSFLGLIIDIIPQLGLSEFGAILAVTIIGQITKALNNLSQGKEMGFSKK